SLPGDGHTVTGVAFHAGGKQLITVTGDGTLVQWDPAAGKRGRTLKGHPEPGAAVGFRADGEHFSFGPHDGVGRVWQTESGREIARGPGALVPHLSTILSPDGKRLATASLGSVHLLEVRAGKWQAATVFRGIGHMVVHLAFSADGQRLAAAIGDGT